jgi:hypothetical protein
MNEVFADAQVKHLAMTRVVPHKVLGDVENVTFLGTGVSMCAPYGGRAFPGSYGHPAQARLSGNPSQQTPKTGPP